MLQLRTGMTVVAHHRGLELSLGFLRSQSSCQRHTPSRIDVGIPQPFRSPPGSAPNRRARKAKDGRAGRLLARHRSRLCARHRSRLCSSCSTAQQMTGPERRRASCQGRNAGGPVVGTAKARTRFAPALLRLRPLTHRLAKASAAESTSESAPQLYGGGCPIVKRRPSLFLGEALQKTVSALSRPKPWPRLPIRSRRRKS